MKFIVIMTVFTVCCTNARPQPDPNTGNNFISDIIERIRTLAKSCVKFLADNNYEDININIDEMKGLLKKCQNFDQICDPTSITLLCSLTDGMQAAANSKNRPETYTKIQQIYSALNNVKGRIVFICIKSANHNRSPAR